MIHELQDVISWMLEQLPLKGFGISFEQPTQQWAARLQKATINVFLYDIRENPILRQHTFEQIGNGTDKDRKVVEKRSPLRMDCFYLITGWGIDDKKALTEQQLLSQCILTLARFPLLNPSRIKVEEVGEIAVEQLRVKVKDKHINTIQQEIRARLASHDVLTNPAEIWSSLATPIRPSLSYVVNLPMNPWQPVIHDQLVEAPTLRLGQTEWMTVNNELMPVATFHEKNGGEVQHNLGRINAVIGHVIDRRSDINKKKLPAKVYLVDLDDKKKSRLAKIGEDGRFAFTYLPLGKYKLQLWIDNELMREERRIEITPESHILDKTNKESKGFEPPFEIPD